MYIIIKILLNNSIGRFKKICKYLCELVGAPRVKLYIDCALRTWHSIGSRDISIVVDKPHNLLNPRSAGFRIRDNVHIRGPRDKAATYVG